MSTVMTEQRCYTVKDLQKILGLSRPVVYELLKRNEFRWIMIGGKYRISKKSFDEWLDGEIIRSGKGQTQGEQKPEENRNDKTDRRNSP